MNNQITYADKVALNQNSSIPDINKVNASDMNEIKSFVNATINGSIPMGNIIVDSIVGKNLCEPNAYPCSASASYCRISSMTPVNSPYSTSNTYRGVAFIAKVEANKTYTFSSDLTGSNIYVIGIYSAREDVIDQTKILQVFTSATFTPTYNGYAVIGNIASASGTSMSWTWQQLELGSTATPYTPFQKYGSNDLGNAVVDSIRSKNFLNINPYASSNGVTLTKNTDGSITANGQLTSSWFAVCNYQNIELEAGTYTFSIDSAISYNCRLDVKYYDNTTQNMASITSGNTSVTYTFAKKVIAYFIEFPTMTSGTNVNMTIKFQLEKGPTATNYSSYQGFGYVSGSNANGNYVKYNDGRLEVWGKKNLGSVAITIASGSVYVSSSQTALDFPYTFVEAPIFRDISAISGSGFYWIITANAPTVSTTGTFWLCRGSSDTITNATICYHAIGRWK